MFWTTYSLIILNISVFAFAVVYLYIFNKTREKYIGYWGFSWILYGLGILLDVLVYKTTPYFIIQQLIYSLSIYLLLLGTYVFIDEKISKKWLYILVSSIIWSMFGFILNLSYFITIFPLSLSFSIISIYTGVIFLQNWEFEGNVKMATGIAFLIWGIHKSYYLYLHPTFSITPTSYITEILLIIGLNSCLLLTYLQKNSINLKKNEQVYRLLTENSQDLIYLSKYTPEPSFEYISPNCEKIIGYSQNDFYDNPYLLDDVVHPDDKYLYELTLNPKLSPKESVTLRYKHKDGRYLWVNEYTTLIYDKNGNLFGIEGIIRDITEKIKINEKIKKAEKERQKLLSNISHELKTPITTIRGYVDAILDDKIPSGVSHSKYLENIQNKIHMLDLLINDLFELSQFESNQIQFQFSQISVEELLNSLHEKFSDDIKHVGLSFLFYLDPIIIEKNIEIIADIERIEQAFYNLLYNAIKNTPKGGSISINCELYNDNKIIILISDTGKGIPKQDLPHIFKRFYKGSNTIEKKGSGLGLAITKEIINKHKAQIYVESEINEGTTFRIIFPINKI